MLTLSNTEMSQPDGHLNYSDPKWHLVGFSKRNLIIKLLCKSMTFSNN